MLLGPRHRRSKGVRVVACLLSAVVLLAAMPPAIAAGLCRTVCDEMGADDLPRLVPSEVYTGVVPDVPRVGSCCSSNAGRRFSADAPGDSRMAGGATAGAVGVRPILPRRECPLGFCCRLDANDRPAPIAPPVVTTVAGPPLLVAIVSCLDELLAADATPCAQARRWAELPPPAGRSVLRLKCVLLV